MRAAEVISFEEVRARKQWDALRHQLHEQNPQNLRRNVLPTECMDWPFLMRYEHLTCALIELV
jgi:hypothetical protein